MAKKNSGQLVAQALMLQSLRALSDAEIVSFVAVQLNDMEDELSNYIGHRLDLVALQLEAGDAPANRREQADTSPHQDFDNGLG